MPSMTVQHAGWTPEIHNISKSSHFYPLSLPFVYHSVPKIEHHSWFCARRYVGSAGRCNLIDGAFCGAKHEKLY